MNALIFVAVALIAIGLLVTVFLWLRDPHSGESEFVTVAELQARLEHEPTDQQTAEEPSDDDRPRTDEPESTGSSATEPKTPTEYETGRRGASERPTTAADKVEREKSGPAEGPPEPGDAPGDPDRNH